MTTALNVSSLMDENDLDLEQIANSKIFYIEGYMVTSEDNYKVTLKALDHLKDFPDVKIALSLSDPGIVMGFKDKFRELESYGLDYIFGNDDEAKAFVEEEDIDKTYTKLQNKPYISIITVGEKGSVVISKDEIIDSPQVKITPIDTNGAGDMFAGGVLHQLSNGFEYEISAKFGCFLASKGVENFGPRLPDQDYIRNKELFEKM